MLNTNIIFAIPILTVFALQSSNVIAENKEYAIYYNKINICQNAVSANLLASPSFNGTTWEAETRAEASCLKRFGTPPPKYHGYEQEYINKLKEAVSGNWNWDSIISGASEAAEENKPGLFSFNNKKALNKQINFITDSLVIYNKACDFENKEEMRSCYKIVREATQEFVEQYNAKH